MRYVRFWPGLRHRSDATERPLTSVAQSSTREGPLRIIEPPFLAADHSAVDDPKQTLTLARTGLSRPAPGWFQAHPLAHACKTR